jgi:hypothetical protein
MAPPTSSGGRFNLRCAGLVAAAVSDWWLLLFLTGD